MALQRGLDTMSDDEMVAEGQSSLAAASDDFPQPSEENPEEDEPRTLEFAGPAEFAPPPSEYRPTSYMQTEYGPLDYAPSNLPPAGEAITGDVHQELVTCPECNWVQSITPNRRDAYDFCRSCDYPLFWRPSSLLRDEALNGGDQSLRRLPGTVGRTSVASVPCPHCEELNTLMATTCVRCGLPMYPVEEPPPPPPLIAPLPPPIAEDRDKRIPWWVWMILTFVIFAGIVVGILTWTGVIVF